MSLTLQRFILSANEHLNSGAPGSGTPENELVVGIYDPTELGPQVT